MLEKPYIWLLRLPHFRGKSRIEALFRRTVFWPRPVEVVEGLKMMLDPLEWTQISLLKDGVTEPKTVHLFKQLLSNGDVYIDVGAHVGFHSLVARRYVGVEGQVIALEPQPYNCDRIMSNWKINDFENLVLYVGAAGAEQGMIKLHNQSETDKSRLSLCLEPVNDQHQAFYVPIFTLENLLRENKIQKVKLLKIDVEGYEIEVLHGLGTLLQLVENIILEVLHGTETLHEKSERSIAFLMANGFELRTVEGASYKPGDTASENNVWALRRAE